MPTLGRPTRNLRSRTGSTLARLRDEHQRAQQQLQVLQQHQRDRDDSQLADDLADLRVRAADAHRRHERLLARPVRPPATGMARTATIVLIATLLWALAAMLWTVWLRSDLSLGTPLETRLFAGLMLALPICGSWLLWRVNSRERHAAHQRWRTLTAAAERAARDAERAIQAAADSGGRATQVRDAIVALTEQVRSTAAAIDEAERTGAAGRTAQQQVGERLADLYADQGLVAHEITFGFDGDIDHVVATGDVFAVVETKAGRGPLTVDARGHAHAGGRTLRPDPVGQVRAAGRRLQAITGVAPTLVVCVPDGSGQATTLQAPHVHLCGLDDLHAAVAANPGDIPTAVQTTVARQWRQRDRRLLVQSWLDAHGEPDQVDGTVRTVNEHGTFVDIADGVTIRLADLPGTHQPGDRLTVVVDEVNYRKGLLEGHASDQ